MTTFQPITPNWLTAVWDQFVADDPELQQAYDYTDYPSEMSGEGNWLDMYLTPGDEFPVGRLWLNFETENIGLQQLPNGNISYATKVALELREFHNAGVSPILVYAHIRNDYYCGVEQTGELAQAAT